MSENFKHTEITNLIIKAFYRVYNQLGHGFLDLATVHEVQLVNYLKATKVEVGLLLNFGPEPQFKRRVFSNSYHSKSK